MNTHITNTRDQDPLITLFSAMSGGIEAQEAQGQRELVHSSQLPSNGLLRVQPLIEAAGGKVLGPTSGDALFSDVELPAGWVKKGSDHSLWSELVDDQGKVIASIFYKAASYDRDAFIQLKS